MIVSYNWLKEIIDFGIEPEALAHRLSFQGLETKVHSRDSGDTKLEIEPTSNRPDCLSVMGVAREIDAMTHAGLKHPLLDETTSVGKNHPVSLEIKRPDLCPRYTGVLLEDVVVKPSPEWLRLRLEQHGIRSINNVVDVTNYVLLEYGHPTHAFDAELISGSKINIDVAGQPSKFRTLDGIERSLEPDMLLIWDARRPLALAGVMGGENSQIRAETKKIFLESAYFEARSIRRTSKRLNVSTESSYRFERGADPDAPLTALKRIVFLLKQSAHARVSGEIIDSYPRPIVRPKIQIRFDRVARILGVALDASQIAGILKSLRFEITQVTDKTLAVSPPSYRLEVAREIDVIEEIARVYGYDRIPKTSPRAPIGAPKHDRQLEIIGEAENVLLGLGFNEVITYSFIGPDDLKTVAKTIDIPNPLSADQSVMRTSLIPGLLRTSVRNQNVMEKDFSIFETGRIYHFDSSANKIREPRRLAFLTCRRMEDAKGVLDALVRHLKIPSYDVARTPHEWCKDHQACYIGYQGRSIGWFGPLSEEIKKKYGLELNVIAAELELDNILGDVPQALSFQPLPKYPAVTRDLALVMDERVTYRDCVACIRSNGGEWLRDIRLFDVYRGKPLTPGQKSLGFTLTYIDPRRTLTEKDVDDPHHRIIRACFEHLNAELRPQ